MADQTEVLAQAPGVVPMGGIPGVSYTRPKTSEEARQQQTQIMGDIGRAQERIGIAQTEQERIRAEGASAAAREAKKGAEAIERGITRTREQFPFPEFHPTKDNVTDLATLFSLVGVIGTAMGGSGKMSAMNALQSMTGMMQGWQQGRQDLWAREKGEFDKNMARVKSVLDDAYKDADRAYKMLATNRDAANALAVESAAKLGGQIGREILAKQGLERYYQYLSGVVRDLGTVEERTARREERQEARAERRQDRAEARAGRAQVFQGSDGKMYTFDPATREVTPIEMPEGVTLAKPTGRAAGATGAGGAVQFRYNSAMVNAGNQLAIEVGNAADLPAKATPPAAAEVLTNPAKDLTDSTRAFFAQKITSEDARSMQQVLAGMQRAMTTIEASGRPSGATEAAIREFGKTMPRAGDSKVSIYLFLAQTRQVMEILEKDLRAAGATQAQIDQAVDARKQVDDIITWTVKDVNRIISKGGPRLVDDRVRQLLGNAQTLREFNQGLKTRKAEQQPAEKAPAGVEQEVWNAMTPEERALWQK